MEVNERDDLLEVLLRSFDIDDDVTVIDAVVAFTAEFSEFSAELVDGSTGCTLDTSVIH